MRRLAISSSPGEARAAILEGDDVIALRYLRDEGRLAGGIYAARVSRIAGELDLAFLTLPGAEAVLPLRHAHHLARGRPEAIGDCVCEGELVTVKILKDARRDDDKLAVASARLTKAERALGEGGDEPAELAPPPTAAAALIDWGLRFDIEEARFDDADALNAAKGHAPAGIALEFSGPGLFADCGAEAAIDAALESEVPLPSGGHLLIEETRTGVMIDVNSGRAAAGLAGGAMRRRVNLEAAERAVREALLRNLSGLIIVDFLDVGGRREAGKLLAALDEALAHDPRPVERTGLSRLSVVEIARRVDGPSLARTLLTPQASAWTVETAVLAKLRRLCDEGGAGAGPITLSLDGQENAWLTARPHLLEQVMRRTGRPVTVQPDAEDKPLKGQ